ncbi:MAG: hypothetical protein WD200_00510 [Candidatus Andersenbacteria bacterium]
MKKIRLKALVGSSTLSLMLAAAPAFAANVDVTGDNLTTGPNSVNRNTYRVNDSSRTHIRNVGDVLNQGFVDARTGNNTQSNNTTGGDLDTGGLTGGASWNAVVNAAADMAGLESELDVTGDFVNDTTGPNSRNVNRLTVRSHDSLYLRNVAYITNILDVDHRSGKNEQSNNTTVGGITTGGANVDVTTDSFANNFDGAFVGSNMLDVDVMGENNTTGPNSENVNRYQINNRSSARVTNRANITNVVEVDSRTGKNTQTNNTTGGDITTGGVDVTVNHTATANSGGGGAGATSSTSVGAGFVNDTTGPNSSNTNTLNVNNSSSTSVSNDATVTNVSTVDAHTGNNESSNNTEGGSIQTGDVDFNFSSDTEVNS